MYFFVEGAPQGKARPRFSRRSGTVYTPKKTAAYEEQIRRAFLEAGGEKLDGDCYISVTVDAFFPVPKSYPKRKAWECAQNIRRPSKKPDTDNILKAVLDALNGMAYEDDKQVIYLTCRKYYAAKGNGYLKVFVEEVKA